jgi:D-serine deaminase-like pyridoxal phosphate-dependent protein
MQSDWMQPENLAEISSPALLVFPDRVEENLRRMIAMVGDPARVRPHIKTHKLPEIIAIHHQLGVSKCKAATIAEAEMALANGMQDVLLAAQPVGPNIERVIALIHAYPEARLQTVIDDPSILSKLGAAATREGVTVNTLLDLDVGQHRTGITPGPDAVDLYHQMTRIPGLTPSGLHAYDGHLHQRDVGERRSAAEAVYGQVSRFRDELEKQGMVVPQVVIGGTPTFPFYAQHVDVECSPGTCVLWDAGYAANHADLDFLHAAVLLTRVISRPAPNRLCLDLGHKAVASEMPHPRVVFPALPDALAVAHNEEHLVIETSQATEFPVGSALMGIPWHICPTVALHETVHVVKNGRVTEEWTVTARRRKLVF